jgi:hypothetical protein
MDLKGSETKPLLPNLIYYLETFWEGHGKTVRIA